MLSPTKDVSMIILSVMTPPRKLRMFKITDEGFINGFEPLNFLSTFSSCKTKANITKDTHANYLLYMQTGLALVSIGQPGSALVSLGQPWSALVSLTVYLVH